MIDVVSIFRNFVRRRGNIRILEKMLDSHIVPVHYYSPIPDTRELSPDIYTKINPCHGIDFKREQYIETMKNAHAKYGSEYVPYTNSGLAKMDAFMLYSFIRDKKPAKFIEIGSGESTKIILQALRKNREEGIDAFMYAIEPYPKEYLRTMNDPGFTLIDKKVQEVASSLFENTDMLFIDSSHVSKIGSDVNLEIFEIIPRTKKGAWIHWHDIMMPVDYPEGWIRHGNMFWNESYIVQAFMMYNTSFEIRWPAKYMQVQAAKETGALFPFFDPSNSAEQLSSFWIERIA